MDRYEKIIESALQSGYSDPEILRTVRRYLAGGEQKTLRYFGELIKKNKPYVLAEIANKLPVPTQLDEVDKRVIHIVAVVNCRHISEYLDKHLSKEKDIEDYVKPVLDALKQAGLDDEYVTNTVRHICTFKTSLLTTSAGRWVLAASDKQLRDMILREWSYGINAELVIFLVSEAPQRLDEYVKDIIYENGDQSRSRLAYDLLNEPNSRFEQQIYSLAQKERDTYFKLDLLIQLSKRNPIYSCQALKLAKTTLSGSAMYHNHRYICQWMIQAFGAQAVPEIADFIRYAKHVPSYSMEEIISYTSSKLGKDSLPVLLAGIDSSDAKVRLAAVSELIAYGDVSHSDIIVKTLEHGLAESDAEIVIRYISVAARWNASVVSESLWKLAVNKSKPLRIAASHAIANMGESVLDRAISLLSSKKTDHRISAVIIISSINGDKARNALDEAVAQEENDGVREEMLSALKDTWKAAGKRFPLTSIEYRASKVAKTGFQAPLWMENITIPQMAYKDGRQVPPDTALYCLIRQKNFADITSPIEMLSFYDSIDRRSSADFALALLHGFIESGGDTKDKWVLAIAGLLGDDRIVPVLQSQVRTWTENGRGKMAEYAVYALSLLASDRALLAIDSIAMKFRNKMKNVGAAAVQAFACAAESLGVTVDELGDRVMPDLGFGPARTKIIGSADRSIEVQIGLGFKLTYTDLNKNVPIKSLPASVPADVKSDMKELGALLRDITRMQSRRMETLMVQQRKWPVEEWRNLFLKHPLLIPFGVRLIWGKYAENGEMTGTFRAMEDGACVSFNGEIVDLNCSAIGLIHPLQIDEALWMRWKDHLDLNQITPPFPQMDRAVVIVDPQQAESVFYSDFEDQDINGMTFKGRAERLGWRRGSVCDAGMITAYVKSYPAAGIDAFITLQDMYVGIDMYSDIKVQKLFFVSYGSVATGSYVYDEPTDSADPRLIQFGRIPRIVYSETIGDMQKITLQNDEQ